MKPKMRIPALVFAASLALAPAAAFAQEEAPSGNPDLSQGAQLLSQGMKLLLQGVMAQGQDGWNQLAGWLGDLSAYEAPERLPNGDIIIRRKEPLPDGATDL